MNDQTIEIVAGAVKAAVTAAVISVTVSLICASLFGNR